MSARDILHAIENPSSTPSHKKSKGSKTAQIGASPMTKTPGIFNSAANKKDGSKGFIELAGFKNLKFTGSKKLSSDILLQMSD